MWFDCMECGTFAEFFKERTQFRNGWNVDESGSVGYGLLCAVPIGIASQVDTE
jgi:hypothetical protein